MIEAVTTDIVSADLSAIDVSVRGPAPDSLLNRMNNGRLAGDSGKWQRSAEALLDARFQVGNRLAVYGSLGPGRSNHHVVAPLGGEWQAGAVRGRLYASGWGAGLGFPGLCVDNQADDVAVALLTSARLVSEWGRLDAFEGDEYSRLVAVILLTPSEFTVANIYALRCDPEATG